MLGINGLKDRISNLKANLKVSEKKFADARDLLKVYKKEINDTKGAILEIERLLIKASE